MFRSVDGNAGRDSPGDHPFSDVFDADYAAEDTPVHKPSFEFLFGRWSLRKGLVGRVTGIEECGDRAGRRSALIDGIGRDCLPNYAGREIEEHCWRDVKVLVVVASKQRARQTLLKVTLCNTLDQV